MRQPDEAGQTDRERRVEIAVLSEFMQDYGNFMRSAAGGYDYSALHGTDICSDDLRNILSGQKEKILASGGNNTQITVIPLTYFDARTGVMQVRVSYPLSDQSDLEQAILMSANALNLIHSDSQNRERYAAIYGLIEMLALKQSPESTGRQRVVDQRPDEVIQIINAIDFLPAQSLVKHIDTVGQQFTTGIQAIPGKVRDILLSELNHISSALKVQMRVKS